MTEGLQKLGDHPAFRELVELLKKQTPQQHERVIRLLEDEYGCMSEADEEPTGQARENGHNAGRRIV